MERGVPRKIAPGEAAVIVQLRQAVVAGFPRRDLQAPHPIFILVYLAAVRRRDLQLKILGPIHPSIIKIFAAKSAKTAKKSFLLPFSFALLACFAVKSFKLRAGGWQLLS